MLKTRLMLVLLAIGMSALLTRTPAAEDEKPSAEKLIEQLSSEEFARRERAALLLQARGAAVLPALRKARKHRDTEVRRRVREMIPFLETAAALEPKRVTLGREPRTLSTILKEIEKQTGYHIGRDDKEDEKLYRVSMKSSTFWEAVERIGRDTGRVVSAADDGKGLRLNPREARSPFVALSGPFRVELTKIHEDNRDIDFTQPGKGKEAGRRDHRLTLTLQVLAEPRFIFLLAERAQVRIAEDNDGQSLGAPAPDKEPEWTYNFVPIARKNFAETTEILLQRSSEKTRRIKVLRGAIPVQVVVESKRVVITNNVLNAKGVKCRVSDGAVEIVKVGRDKRGSLEIHLIVPPKLEDDGPRWQDLIRLEDAKGNLYEPCGTVAASSAGKIERISLTYAASNDPKVGPPSKLLIEVWTTLHYAIPFEFKDVPLP